MSGNMLADKTGVILHSNVVMATLEPYGYVKDKTKVFSNLERSAP